MDEEEILFFPLEAGKYRRVLFSLIAKLRKRDKEERRTDDARQLEPPRHACNFFHAFLEKIRACGIL
jgi:iron-sulfur cluster repair protein YtfE (RIC family)